ncbi:MAG: hypothetical protein JSW28_03305 [Thermoplasmata archaeon]|nr:MAG: hypothetical protein JSW28_03305 [Thermoplasmata archaeon]
MVENTSEGKQEIPKHEFSEQQRQGGIGIKGSQEFYAQQQNINPPPGYQGPSYQQGTIPPGPYYQTGRSPGFPLIPVSPYSRGLAFSVVLMAIGAVIENIFRRDLYPHLESPSALYYFGMVISYIGGVIAFLFGLGLFLMPPRHDQPTGGPSNAQFGIAFVLAAIILGIALH